MSDNLGFLVRRLTGTERENNKKLIERKDKSAILNNCEIIDLNRYKIDKPLIFVLGGNQTLEAQIANGIAKIPCDMIAVEDQADVVSMVYPHKQNNCEIGLVGSVYIQRMVDSILKPLFVDENGKKLDIDLACKKARLVTFFCFCYGAEVLLSINKCLSASLKHVGYGKEEIKEILRQLVSISWGAGFVNEYNTVFEAKTLEDEVYGYIYRNDISEYLNTHPEEKPNWEIEDGVLYLGAGKLMKKDNGYYFYTQEIGKGNSPLKQPNHSPVVIARKKNWSVDPTTTSIRGEYTSLMMSYVLANAVLNSMKNNKAKSLIPFEISRLEGFFNKLIVEEQGSLVEKSRKRRMEERYKKRPILDIMKKLGRSELEYLHNFDLLRAEILENKAFEHSLDVNGTLYEHLRRIKKPSTNLGRKVFGIMDIISSEIAYYENIVVSADGNAYILKDKDDISLPLNLKFYNPKGLKNSIRVISYNKKNKKRLYIYDNYGSVDDVEYETLDGLVETWRELYKDKELTIKLTPQQMLAVKNYANARDVEEDNIIFMSSDGLTSIE